MLVPLQSFVSSYHLLLVLLQVCSSSSNLQLLLSHPSIYSMPSGAPILCPRNPPASSASPQNVPFTPEPYLYPGSPLEAPPTHLQPEGWEVRLVFPLPTLLLSLSKSPLRLMASSCVTPGLSSFYWHLVPPSLSLPPSAPGSSFPLFSKSCRILGDFSDPMDSYQTPCPHSFLAFPNPVTSIRFVLWPLSLMLYPKPCHHSELLPFCSWSCDDYCGGTMRCLTKLNCTGS